MNAEGRSYPRLRILTGAGAILLGFLGTFTAGRGLSSQAFMDRLFSGVDLALSIGTIVAGILLTVNRLGREKVVLTRRRWKYWLLAVIAGVGGILFVVDAYSASAATLAGWPILTVLYLLQLFEPQGKTRTSPLSGEQRTALRTIGTVLGGVGVLFLGAGILLAVNGKDAASVLIPLGVVVAVGGVLSARLIGPGARGGNDRGRDR